MFSLVSLLTAVAVLAAAPVWAQDAHLSTGPATTINEGLIDCGRGSRISAVGEIETEDGTTRIVPADTHFLTGPQAADLYNGCAGFEPGALSEVDIGAVEVVDAGGSEEFTALIFADNYFELYVNGDLIAVDPVPFTPFNSSVVRFAADRPVRLAVMGVDWEENLGLGSEAGRGAAYHPGDAGIVMHVLDGAGETAAFWDIPEGWMQPGFDDSTWPAAVAYSNETVGVNTKPGYTNFTEVFDTPGADARFIWTSNLVLDNLVLLRTTID